MFLCSCLSLSVQSDKNYDVILIKFLKGCDIGQELRDFFLVGIQYSVLLRATAVPAGTAESAY